MSGTVCRKCRVRGRVQGVFFRASTADRARKLGLSGHAINLPDGSVEVLVAGAADKVEELCRWLAQGPPLAQVSEVSCEPAEISPTEGFRTA